VDRTVLEKCCTSRYHNRLKWQRQKGWVHKSVPTDFYLVLSTGIDGEMEEYTSRTMVLT
jgi:hypothetical protein